ncbi:dihydrofolate reductase family protein [Flavihumibacter sp. CACIAM 22H1]|uniref:dihydrofolate reductase family protein n=1 Tax=Flavihumibacter sp. CACIAM 22H1 TaxID=1812911 RepID=UPI0007A8D4AC|nr:dihydrofolate reductase family protein [Flavihumibacter sp. CACIAM 22H1]KYP14210.1 MAG: deaminase [Flavihumibacter sp. CACIAM 22H1]
MRKLKLQVQTTIDGFMGGPNGEMDFIHFPWTKDIEQYVTDLTEPVDSILLGRKLAEGFIPHWAGVAADDTNPEQAAGKKFTDTPKIVFSNTLKNSPWDNTTVTAGPLTDVVNQLKQQEGGDIIVYGGNRFVQDLIKAELIDELYLFINPSAIGKGMPVFGSLEQKKAYQLQDAIKFDCGILVLKYSI